MNEDNIKVDMPLTKEEREQLILAKIKRIDEDRTHAFQLFEMYYKEPPQENYRNWLRLNEKAKVKLVKSLIGKEDRAMINAAFSLNKLNPKKALEQLKQFKHEQLVEFGIRK